MLDMFVNSCPYAAVFSTWYERGGNCPEITKVEWEKIKLYCDLLCPLLKDSTVLLSASNSPTIHHLIPQMYDLLIHIETCIGQGQAMAEGYDEIDMVIGLSIAEPCKEMHEKWKKYFLDVDAVNAVAHILDPRFKFRFMSQVLKDENDDDLVESSFKPMLYNMYQQYQVNDQEDYAPPVVKTVRLVARTTSRAFLELPPISAESELTGYLQSECELFGTDEDSTIRTWWKSYALTRYPQLSKFARSILAVPATSVPSECTFSSSGRVISEYRSRLHTDTVQAMMLYGDWLKKDLCMA